uniref:G_PROTEIN_RECEP_F1_2 domain-containing protein n=1 Tax=Strongyloides stercoralis TaxID=6248 RepID=A0A0K0E6X2_STRER
MLQNMNNSIEEKYELEKIYTSPYNYLILSIIKAIIGILLCMTSTLLIFVYQRNREFKKKYTNLTIIFKAIADLAFSISLLSESYISIGFLPNTNMILSNQDCLFLLSPQILCFHFKTIIIIAVTFDRYLAIQHPYAYRTFAIKWRITLTLISSLIFSTFSTSLFFFNNNFLNPISSCHLGTIETDLFKSYFIFTGLSCSTLVISIYIFMIASTLNPKRIKDAKKGNKKYHKVAKMLFLLLSIYLFFWFLPFLIFKIIESLIHNNQKHIIIAGISLIILSNPIISLMEFAIYLRYHKEIRKTLHRDVICFSWLNENNGTAALVLRTGLGLLGATIKPDKEMLVDYGFPDSSKII